MSRAGVSPGLDPDNWVDGHGDYLYRFALARVSDPDVAEELVQEGLLAALAARGSFAGRATERTWLTAILKRKLADWVRREVRRRGDRPPGEDRVADGRFTRAGKWRKPPALWATDPADELTRAEFRAAFYDCLGRLPPRLRLVLVARYVDDTPADAVAEAMDIRPGNLWVLLHRGRARLRQCLEVNWFGGPT